MLTRFYNMIVCCVCVWYRHDAYRGCIGLSLRESITTHRWSPSERERTPTRVLACLLLASLLPESLRKPGTRQQQRAAAVEVVVVVVNCWRTVRPQRPGYSQELASPDSNMADTGGVLYTLTLTDSRAEPSKRERHNQNDISLCH